MDTNTQIQELKDQITKLKGDVENLTANFYKNNFSSSQTFTKGVIFNTSVKLPHFTSFPSRCEVGEIIEVGGVVYLCTVANTTWNPLAFA